MTVAAVPVTLPVTLPVIAPDALKVVTLAAAGVDPPIIALSSVPPLIVLFVSV